MNDIESSGYFELLFPGIGGFSSSNLWRAKLFYETYADNTKLAPLVREIAWSHNILIFEKCRDDLEREFYIRMALKFGWTKNVLLHQIENKSFDFLELTAEHSEHQLEEALIINIRNFLCEMGFSFAFLGNQFRLTVDDEDFFIDLLLYHRELRCLVAVELKIGDFKPEYKGKMEFYLNLLNDRMKLPHENDSIGIIICKNKKRTIVEYALKTSVHPIGVSTYSISPALPESYKNLLPDAKTIARKLQAFNIDSSDQEIRKNENSVAEEYSTVATAEKQLPSTSRKFKKRHIPLLTLSW